MDKNLYIAVCFSKNKSTHSHIVLKPLLFRLVEFGPIFTEHYKEKNCIVIINIIFKHFILLYVQLNCNYKHNLKKKKITLCTPEIIIFYPLLLPLFNCKTKRFLKIQIKLKFIIKELL